jgi:N-acetylmuramoyl-L-alanine amidase
MVLATAAGAQQRTAAVVFGYTAADEFRGVRVGDECFVPLTSLAPLGWTYSVNGGTASLRAEDRDFQLPLRQVRGESMVPLVQAAKTIGAVPVWKQDTLHILSQITAIKVRQGVIEVSSTVPIKPRVTLLTSPNRVQIDFPGSQISESCKPDLSPAAKLIPLESSAKLVLETSFVPEVEATASGRTREFHLEVKIPQEPVAPPVEQTPLPRDVDLAKPVPAQLATVAGPLRLDIESTSAALLLLDIRGKLTGAVNFRRPEPNVVEVVLPGATIEIGEKPTSESIESVETRQEGMNGILVMRLNRPMGLEVATNASQVSIQLLKPVIGDGKIAGKTIVIDAGHGGTDSGAKAKDGSALEKNLTLSIAKLTSQALAQEGATVIMTRKTDVFIPLTERPAVANRNGADFFISIHINSNKLDNSTSGSIVFYHRKNAVGQLLADCINREIAKVSNLPTLGTWSDTRIYNTGFAVLRGAKQPAVLIELGFINHSQDRKRMMESSYQEAVSKAIVRGIKVFLGNGQ